ncbi:hypothetical protein PR202_gb12831 [Eleusine coracana subsp. coracana]|uniref:Uncharacterized protein n=1 Tax=Eleusine coracana subsp. coracana TaxID=191504 RepID=A0AAV5ERG9_ELECO|nr:hypothetical protein PR202_gb12831 [Eleusine coracana subsp. coracana]
MDTAAAAAHVLVFPWPRQGHINCMLQLATALAGADVHVTFLHTEHNLRHLAHASTASYPRLRFLSIPDGLPDDHPRALATATGAYRSLLTSLSTAAGSPPGRASSDDAVSGFPPVTCVVADILLPWAGDIAEDLGVPALAFCASSACSFLAVLSVPKLLELGELPFPAGGDLDEPVRGVPGMESILRRRDLPSWCRRRHGDTIDPLLQRFADLTAHSCKARALVLNTAAALERSALAHAIGPLHATSPSPSAATSLWREDDGCLAWLDAQADRSVVYLSLGSLAVVSHDRFTEFLSGLVGAGRPFLWVLQPDMVDAGQDAALREAIDAAGTAKARVVPWALQRDVLGHRAVGWFLTVDAQGR